MLAIGPAFIQFFAYKQRQNKIVDGSIAFRGRDFAERGTPQAARAMHQSSHEQSVRVAKLGRKCRKLDGLTKAFHDGAPCLTAFAIMSSVSVPMRTYRLFAGRYQQLVHKVCFCIEKRISAPVRIVTEQTFERSIVAGFLETAKGAQGGRLFGRAGKKFCNLKSGRKKLDVLWLDSN